MGGMHQMPKAIALGLHRITWLGRTHFLESKRALIKVERMVEITQIRPIIVFAKSSGERDYLRNILAASGWRILCFENETTCYDNLASIEPEAVVLGTDSRAVAWRFIFSLDAFASDAQVIIRSNVLNESAFNAHQLVGRTIICMDLQTELKDIRFIIEAGRYRSDRFDQSETGSLVGESVAIKNIQAMLPNLTQTQDPVLIIGKAGTGKELLARIIGRHASFGSLIIKIDCEALRITSIDEKWHASLRDYNKNSLTQPGGLTHPRRATILLHKIDQLDLKSQSEMLLLLEKGTHYFQPSFLIDDRYIRVIATSESDLEDMVRRNGFRRDLYYRLNVIPLYMPLLSERKEDLPLLTDYFSIGECVKRKRSILIASDQIKDRACDYHWPGNMEELKMAVRRYVFSGDERQLLAHTGIKSKNISNKHLCKAFDHEILPDALEIQNYWANNGNGSLKSICNKFVRRTEKKLMETALQSTNWNRKKAAALLNISYKSMLNKMKMYQIV
jgi:two-component system response regulator AtoC